MGRQHLNSTKMKKNINTKLSFGIIVVLLIVATAAILFVDHFARGILEALQGLPISEGPPLVEELEDFKKFSSEEEFKAYIEEGQLAGAGYYGLGGGILSRQTADFAVAEEGIAAPTAPKADGLGGAEPDRVSGTTVQVSGVDEPDIVKTDGKEIYFSQEALYYWRGGFVEEIGIVPPEKKGETKAIRAFPPADLAIDSAIERTGKLLLVDDILVIFAGDKIYGYDVVKPESIREEWKVEFEDNSYLADARLYKDKIYLITSSRISPYRPCPITPLSYNGADLTVKCADIYHPSVNLPVDITYTALQVDVETGEIEKSISFVANSGNSVLYMSENALYVTYSYTGDFVKFTYNFFKEKASDLAPADVLNKLEKLMGYDISQASKMTELNVIIEQWQSSLSNDERLKLENELTNRMQDYHQEHKRDLAKTGIVKVDLARFGLAGTGNVPGTPLNQFSLDEYEDHLRVATTIGERWGMFGGLSESANDVYVLDKDMETVGSILDLGLTERIYSVRFIDDKGYVVTFRQVDPFYVLDLSVPENPEKKGELKIPGYSSYLHPITKDKVLGIGKEGSNVKLSLFDVEDPANPTEASKYMLDEYWSDVLNTHHAFLLDSKHNVFFMPGSKGGYIFSYENNNLQLQRAVSNIQAQRAIYINDYMYILGANKIVVLNEIDWEKVNELEL